ncbi:aminoglycoside phosphotransferase [Streptomyces sp. NBC_00829]|uniref:aminoglycoside phosphotransferase n=1 Tax=Streptomyces sp. NBC_00829 TaxID=2903679 RepID=UPI00386A5D22|nr:aminoglycoside phosphotransferase family protein [Streptomyces sp. NBC_00829]
MSERVQWEELPSELRNAVEARTGPVITSENVAEGLNCSVALVVHTRTSGPLFLKGVRTSDAAGMVGLRCEEQINETVAGISPTILYRFEVGGWFCLAFIYVDGRHADLSPGTEDLAAVAFTMGRMQQLIFNEPLPFGRFTFTAPQLAERFAKFLNPGEAAALKGTNLLHTDANPHNIMIGDDCGDAYVVDWAMPAIGPAWVDPAYTAVRLMECGQTPSDALGWLGGFASWRQADPKAVEVFVNATCRHWTATVGEKGAEPSNARFRHLLGFPA